MPQSRRRKLHLALGHAAGCRCVCCSSRFATSSNACVGCHAVEEARIDHHAVVDIGLVGDLERCRDRRLPASPPGRPAGRICWRSRGRAGRPTGSRRWRPCRTPSARNWRRRPAASSSDRTDGRRGCRCRSPSSRPSPAQPPTCPCGGISSMNVGQRRIGFGRLLGQRMIGGDRHEGRAEDRVGPRRIDLELALAAGVRPSASGQRISRPSDRPIQLRCISRTFSGHSVERRPARPAVPARNR